MKAKINAPANAPYKNDQTKSETMTNTYHLNASDLNQKFLEKIKAEFGDRPLQITITEMDETEYLLASEANRTRLLQAIENVKNRKNCVEVSWEELG